jgi:hypothetical protein
MKPGWAYFRAHLRHTGATANSDAFSGAVRPGKAFLFGVAGNGTKMCEVTYPISSAT